RRDTVARLEERGRKSGGDLPVIGRQVRVAGGESEPVGLPDRFTRLDPDREVEIADHAADDGDLLEVLHSEEGGVGLDLVEEPGDDRRDSAKVAGTDSAFTA